MPNLLILIIFSLLISSCVSNIKKEDGRSLASPLIFKDSKEVSFAKILPYLEALKTSNCKISYNSDESLISLELLDTKSLMLLSMSGQKLTLRSEDRGFIHYRSQFVYKWRVNNNTRVVLHLNSKGGVTDFLPKDVNSIFIYKQILVKNEWSPSEEDLQIAKKTKQENNNILVEYLDWNNENPSANHLIGYCN